MTRAVAVLAAAGVLLLALDPAVHARAWAADPFPRVEIEPQGGSSHLLAYSCMISGVGLIAWSFPLSKQADGFYHDYLAATDPGQITDLYDRTEKYDHYSSAALIGGEVLLATGIYLRFLRRAPPARVQLSLGPERCVLFWRF